MTKTKTTGEPQPPRYLLITEERSNGYLHLYGRVVTQRYEQGAYHPDSPDDQYGDGPLYSGLQLRCQGDQDSRRRVLAGERDAPVYGFACEYRDVYHVDRRKAVRMAKTLTTLEAKLDKLAEARGHVRTYGEYVGRVAEALGCVGLASARSPKSQQMTGWPYLWDSIGAGVSRIDRQIDLWVDEARPQPQAAADGDVAQEVSQ